MDASAHPALLQRQRVNEGILQMMQELTEALLQQRNNFLREREGLENRIVALETENEVLKKSVDTHLVVINDLKFEIESLRAKPATIPTPLTRTPQRPPLPPTYTAAVVKQAVEGLNTMESSLTTDPELAALIKAYRSRNNMQ
ncbi:hypothetical protein QR46_0122 [Giardia duodenalis assemblage B]|uniref:Uncharacterized protein n=1 Tax=Giardia duodenalis assemblage B TaxID=1394984 RepID=A0A132P0G8_GIAIN|nr:hypothetical protein QR46_0122 [Giardia intestinalis assemblage B]